MARFYLPPAAWKCSPWELVGDEARHAAKVLRLQVGDECDIFDGRGRCARARILSVSGSTGLTLQKVCEHSHPPLLAELTLCQAIPKGANMDLIVQKAVELGVSYIQPLLTERTVVRLNPVQAMSKQQKWQRIALEACKQCGQNTMPIVKFPLSFEQWIREALSFADSTPAVHIIASLMPGVQPVRKVLEQARNEHVRYATLLVGPEGDFSPRESAAAIQAGFVPVSFGNIVLRVETAAFFGLSVMRYALD